MSKNRAGNTEYFLAPSGFIGALPAIYDSPILGHGAWAEIGRISSGENGAGPLGIQRAVLMTRDDFIAGTSGAFVFIASLGMAVLLGDFLGVGLWIHSENDDAYLSTYGCSTALFSLVAFSLLWKFCFLLWRRGSYRFSVLHVW